MQGPDLISFLPSGNLPVVNLAYNILVLSVLVSLYLNLRAGTQLIGTTGDEATGDLSPIGYYCWQKM